MRRYWISALLFAFLACSAFAVQDVASAVVVTVKAIDRGAKTVIVKTADGTEHTIRFTGRTVAHGVDATAKGAKDAFLGMKEGDEVIVHYTLKGGDKVADEVDHIGKDGLKMSVVVVKSVDHGAKVVTVKTADGAEETFHLTDRAARSLVGDTCRFGDRTGTVEDIGLRSTRIRTPDRTLVTVPNAQFSSMRLENLSRRDKIWFHPVLSLTRETSPAQIRLLLDSISQLLGTSPKVDPASRSVRFAAVGAYSLDLDVSAYVLTSDDDEFSRIQQELLLRILEAVEGDGARLAVPTQATITYKPNPASSSKDLRPMERP